MDWKIAKVVPIYNCGDNGNPNNYRPIFILAIISTITERAVNEQLKKFLYDNNLLSQFQSGF